MTLATVVTVSDKLTSTLARPVNLATSLNACRLSKQSSVVPLNSEAITLMFAEVTAAEPSSLLDAALVISSKSEALRSKSVIVRFSAPKPLTIRLLLVGPISIPPL